MRTLALGVLLVVATLLAYAGIGDHPFHIRDDRVYISENESVREGLTWVGMAEAFTRVQDVNWHPLTSISQRIDVELFGLEPGGHHWVNVAIHAANAALLLALLAGATGAPVRSALVAALFALHPLHVESVAWLAERKDVLSTFFGLLALLVWTRGAGWASGRAYAGALALFAASLLSKPMLVTLPFAMLLLDLWPLRRWRPLEPGGTRLPGGLLLEKLPFFALSLASIAVTLATQDAAIKRGHGLLVRLADSIVGYARYLGQTVWPVDLAVLYPHRDYSAFEVGGALVLLLGLSALALLALRRRPYLAVGWLWFLGLLVPVSGLVRFSPAAIADRYTYVPLIGIFIAVSWGGYDLVRGRRRLEQGAALAAVLVVLALGFATRRQVAYWSDDVVLFERTLALTSRNHVAHATLATLLLERGEPANAARHFRAALEIRPSERRAHYGLGFALLQQGDLSGGILELERAVELGPGMPDLLFELGRALELSGRRDEAVLRYLQQLQVDPDHVGARARLAQLRSGSRGP